ncbi:hypothetical protein JM83_3474 [Gillisia sp. Hel_I_86]|uniref:hypothetical protein n=1 Tax=Gillisia sp. Hel_I_86 TaxID=1249981 RepID=UPI00119C6AA6|nr:hypothetical protein [Gillisia sp. Hel_I_86]TVZ28350.1 hypothetical protein JM83_3474 [Gillisia sp. Hel_I_86]
MTPILNFLVEYNEYDIFLTKAASAEGKLAKDVQMVKEGYQVLKSIKRSKSTGHIPMIILSTSPAGKDIDKCYENSKNCFIPKPMDAEDFSRGMASKENLWLTSVQLPFNKYVIYGL